MRCDGGALGGIGGGAGGIRGFRGFRRSGLPGGRGTAYTWAMPRIVLTTFNARYAHTSFGLRYLRANLGMLRDASSILEFDLQHRPMDVAEKILACQPQIVGVGVYIWNVGLCTQLVSLLKRVAPGVKVIVGGPEVSHEVDQQAICAVADHVITGEADLIFPQVCEQLLAGQAVAKVIAAGVPDMAAVTLPYDEYTPADLSHRVVYVEASRGCPFHCEFCLSSLDVPVRNVPAEAFLSAMQSLLDRGVRQFKFVDRTFNLNLPISTAILQFFLDWMQGTPAGGPGAGIDAEAVSPTRRVTSGAGATSGGTSGGGRELFLHFEMIPDRLPEPLRMLIARFPPGSLQLEVGIQSMDEAVTARISRRQDLARVRDNFRFLHEQTGVHIHADLIVGLPGEDMAAFGAGFDQLYALGPQEIQIGILKRLRGAPIARHDTPWAMVYSPDPPYEVLRTSVIDFSTMQRLRRLARYWDLVGNSGNFVETTAAICGATPFASLLHLSDWLHAETGQTHAISLPRLYEALLRFMVSQRGMAAEPARAMLARDYTRPGRRDLPACLRELVVPPSDSSSPPMPPVGDASTQGRLPPRQARHHGTR